MVVLNWPAPLFDAVSLRLAGALPAAVLVALWAIVAAVVSMELYRLASPQRRIGRLAHEAREAQQALNRHDGEFDEAWPLMRRMLSLAGQRVALVLPGTLLAAYPVLALIVWLDSGSPVLHQPLFEYGPDWLRGWEALFFVTLLVTALLYKHLRGIR